MEKPDGMIRFAGAGGEMLAARLDLPEGTVRGCALFAHCFTCSKDSLAASRISRALRARGIAVLRFDFTGLGNSGGDFANTNFSSNVGDLLAAVDYLRQHHAAPKILIGHSLGGAAVLAAASRVPEAVALVTIGAPFRPAHLRRLLEPAIAEIEARGEAEVSLAGRTFRIRKHFLDDIESYNSREAIAGLNKALLIFHSPRDTTVDIENAAQIYAAAKHPKNFVSLDAADHLLTKREDAQWVAEVLAAWAGRYLGAIPAAADAPAVEAGTVEVSETGEGKFAQTIRAGRHVLHADEPESYGGNDSGPSPYGLLLAALGACTSMTLRLYAERNELPLEKITVRLKHDKIHARDCAECVTKDSRLDRIDREIELIGALDEAQRRKLLEVADKCPVHRTLQTETWITTSLGK